MYKIKKFYCFLNESLSISDSSVKLFKIIEVDLDNILKKPTNKIFKYNFNDIDLKISNLNLDIKFFKYKENTCNALSDFQQSTINNSILFETKIELSIYISNLDEDFITYIKSVVLHELVHVFQYYNLKINNKFRPSSWSIGSIISQYRKYLKTDYIKEINELIYKSLNHEIASQIHQYYHYKIDNLKYEKIEKIIDDLNNFKVRKLSNIENFELFDLKNDIYNCILHDVKNKNYIKKVKKSLWNETDLDTFIQKLDKIFKNRAKYIRKKIEKVDKKFIIDYNSYQTTSTEIFNPLYENLEIINLLSDLENIQNLRLN